MLSSLPVNSYWALCKYAGKLLVFMNTGMILSAFTMKPSSFSLPIICFAISSPINCVNCL